MKRQLKKTFLFGTLVCAMLSSCTQRSASETPVEENLLDHTSTQSKLYYDPVYDVRTDVMKFTRFEDLSPDEMKKRVQSWREQGYNVGGFTCLSRMSDYNRGKWDGKMHLDEFQLTMFGDTVRVVVPTKNYIEQAKRVVVKPAVDAGMTALYLEEPEFFGRAGYSEAFKREWKEFYGFDWRPQHLSAENTYLSNKLKAYLYMRAYDELFCYAKEYAKSLGRDIKCYAAVHSIINYAQWHIATVEEDLLKLPCVDGVVSQIWTGTSRELNNYKGVTKERTFETAFLEYNSMMNMAHPRGKRAYFLTDPVEDNIKSWTDYKFNYQSGYVAQMLFPQNNYYDVTPWPDRIYRQPYGINAKGDTTTILGPYATQVQVMLNAQHTMPLSDNRVSGPQGISVMISSSMLYQPMARPLSHTDFIKWVKHNGIKWKHPEDMVDSHKITASEFIEYDRTEEPMTRDNDPRVSNFFGLAMPLVKRGIPVNVTILENVDIPSVWEGTKLMLLSYSNQKPQDAEVHKYIADWVKQGGALVYFGRDNDSFQKVSEWWNQGENHFDAPSEHLFQMMGIDKKAAAGTYAYGRGSVTVVRKDPKELALAADGDTELMDIIKPVYEKMGGELKFNNYFYLERGPYDFIAVMTESVSDDAYVHEGRFIDMFDPALPVITKKTVRPNEQAFLYNLDRIPDLKKPQVLACAGRPYNEVVKKHSYSFVVKAPINTPCAARIYLPSAPSKVETVNEGQSLAYESAWDESSHTLLLKFENKTNGVSVNIKY